MLPDTALLAAWLGRTILTLVTRYTRPGDRVLLFDPPTQRSAALPIPGRGGSPYVGLAEAVWMIGRLNRDADTTTATPAPADLGPNGTESETGPGPDATDTRRSDGVPTSVSPVGRFDLIITAVRPQYAEWFHNTDWNRPLTATGTLAIITHGDLNCGRLRDPIPTVVSTLSNQSLAWLDHIGLLHQHPPLRRQRGYTAANEVDTGAAYHDLLLFGAAPQPLAQTTASHPDTTGDLR